MQSALVEDLALRPSLRFSGIYVVSGACRLRDCWHGSVMEDAAERTMDARRGQVKLDDEGAGGVGDDGEAAEFTLAPSP